MTLTRSPLITDAERSRREEAVKYARASFALEGFTPSAEDLREEQRFIEGTIDLAEFIAIRRERAHEQ
jgi:hypothetical protein